MVPSRLHGCTICNRVRFLAGMTRERPVGFLPIWFQFFVVEWRVRLVGAHCQLCVAWV